MHLFDLTEGVRLNFAGSNRIVDLRGDKRDEGTHIALTKDEGALLFRWGENWSEVYPLITSEYDSNVQDRPETIRVIKEGILIHFSRGYGGWTGERNRYSKDTKEIVSRLLDLQLITPRTKIFFGNWASGNTHELAGSAAQIMKAPETPNKLVLYHGTSNARYSEIVNTGLRSLDKDERVWNRDKNIPAHRNESIYLTSSLSQARYYAEKAVKVDRKRLTTGYLVNIESKILAHHRTLVMQRDYRNFEGMRDTQDQIEKLKKAKDLLSKMRGSVEKLEPVILLIEIPRAKYKNLMADDDYINVMKKKGEVIDPKDWRSSLSYFGQVAYRGAIDPEQIKTL